MSYFNRTSNPLLTILFPSRNRFDLFKRTIDSFADNAKNINNLQIVAKFDTDDDSSLTRLNEIRKDVNIKILISDRKNGYKSLHEYCNEMLEHATGDWVLFVNDDCLMLTKDWDTILENANPSPADKFKGSSRLALLNPQNHIEFPIVRTDICKQLGYFALHNHVDSFLQDIYAGVNARCNVNICIAHQRALMTDQTAHETANAAQLTSPTYGPFINEHCKSIVENLKNLI